MKRYAFLLIFLLLIGAVLAVETDVTFNGNDWVDVIVILKEKPAKGKFDLTKLEGKKDFLSEKKINVKEQQDKVLNKLNSFAVARSGEKKEEKFHRFATIPGFAGEIDQEEFELLKRDSDVVGIFLNRQYSITMNDTIVLINSSRVNAIVQNYTDNLTGTGQTVCVIDTGIDYNHTALGGGWGNRVLGGYDYLNSDADPMDDHGHGTHVAGTIGSTDATYSGVAPGVDFVALKACNAAGGCDGTAMLSSIDWCNNNATIYNISVISISIGDSSEYNSSNCPSTFDSGFATSVGLGITVVVSSGNDGFKNGIASPGCSANATSVGSVGKADAVPSYSNSGELLDLLAPGGTLSVMIRSLGVGGGYADMYGTSMAAPHVSGAVAVLNQFGKAMFNSTYTQSQVFDILNSSGIIKTDSNSINRTRIKLYAALVSVDNVTPSVSFISPATNNTNTGYNHVTVQINASESVSATLQFNNTNHTMTLVDNAVYQKTVAGLVAANYSYLIYYDDDASNGGSTAEYVVTVNNTAPSIDSYVPNSSTASVVEQSSLFFNHSSSDVDGNSLSYYWYLNGSLQSSNVYWNFTPGCNNHGDYNLTLVVSDGYVNATNSWDLEVNNTNCAPTAYILTANGTSVEFGALASLTTNSSDPDGDTLNYTWDLGDGAVVNTTNTTHNYTSTGNFTVVLTVNDTSLTDNYTIYVAVSDTTAAVLSNRYPSSGAELSSGTTSTTISLSTNENATCRYDTSNSSFNFVNGTAFSTTGGTSHSSSVSVSSGNSYNYYVKCNDSYGNINSGSYTISFSVASSSTNTGSSGGGGGSSTAAVASAKKSFYYSIMNAGQNYDLNVNKDTIPFTQMKFSPNVGLNSVDIGVAVISEPPKTLVNNYKFLQITLKNIKDSQITGAQIKFKVNKSWVNEGNYDPTKLSLYRYESGEWVKKTTALTTEDANYYHYFVSVPGFSYFAISAEKKETPIEPAAPAQDFAVQEEVVELAEIPVGGAAVKEIVEDGFNNAWYLLLLLPMALVIYLVIHFTKHKKPEKLTREKVKGKKGEMISHIVGEHKQAAAHEEIHEAIEQEKQDVEEEERKNVEENLFDQKNNQI